MPQKIVVIGAGSASFGLNTLSALMSSPNLRGANLALVDRNSEALDLVGHLAARFNDAWEASFSVSTHTHHEEALPGADFVVLAIEVSPREPLWQKDFEISLKYGVRQPYAENGGPGGLAHTLRNVGPVLEIVRAMEQACPDAWLINYTNPMMRICDTVARYSSIKVVGLCHQINVGYALVGKTLAQELAIQVPPEFIDTHASPETFPARYQVIKQALERIHITAAGLNHFTWMLSLYDQQTGADLYPIFRERWRALPETFEPLTRRVFDAFGLFPIPGDEHLCEYLPWLSDPITEPWEKYEISLYDWDYWSKHRDQSYQAIRDMISGAVSVDTVMDADSEGALEIIENIACAGNHYHLAVNLPNQGQIPNLPEGAIVETPGYVFGGGIQAVTVGPLPGPIAELCRREITVGQLSVDAAVHGDRQVALQSLLLDPVVRDMDTAKLILEDYLTTYRDFLPQFWNKYRW
jgi:alpha-galactosidase